MKKFLLFSLAGVLALGLSAKVLQANRAVQKPMPVAPVALQMDKAVKHHSYSPIMQKITRQDAKTANFVQPTADGSAATSAYYSRSLGEFFYGFSTDFGELSLNGLDAKNIATYTPAFYDATYTAYVGEGASISWTYFDAEDKEYDGGNAETLTQSLGIDWVYAPILTANDSTFRWGYMAPGGGAINFNGNDYCASNQDHSWEWGGSFPIGVNIDDASEYFSDVEAGQGSLIGYAEFVNVDPEHPFVLNGIYSALYCPEVGGTVKVTLYKAMQDEDGNYAGFTDEVISEMEAPETLEPDANNYQMVQFPDMMTTDEGGLDVPIVITEPFIAVISSEDGAQFYPTGHLHMEEIPTEQHAMTFFDIEGEYYAANANYTWKYSDGTSAGSNSAWEFMYDITYNYLHTEDDNIEAPVEGGEYAISFVSLYSSTYPWTVEGVDGNDIPDWITVGNFEDVLQTVDGKQGYTGETNWTITVAPNEGEAREADIRVFYDGAEEIIHVSQAGGGATPLPGDVNLDGNVNTGDVSAVYAVILGTETDPGFIERANVNGDGNVNTGDVSALYSIILGNN